MGQSINRLVLATRRGFWSDDLIVPSSDLSALAVLAHCLWAAGTSVSRDPWKLYLCLTLYVDNVACDTFDRIGNWNLTYRGHHRQNKPDTLHSLRWGRLLHFVRRSCQEDTSVSICQDHRLVLARLTCSGSGLPDQHRLRLLHFQQPIRFHSLRLIRSRHLNYYRRPRPSHRPGSACFAWHYFSC